MKNPGASGVSTAFRLTKREQDVLDLLAYGLTNREIAAHMALSVRTVESYVDRVLGKLGVSTRARAVIEARRAGLLSGDLTSAFPRKEELSNTVTSRLTPLIGREEELAKIGDALENRRLVTLCGTGGVGKTRLALQVGIDLLPRYPDGVWLCDFSSISDAQSAIGVVAQVLGVRAFRDHPLSESIANVLRKKHALLIFDNCEHVAGVVAGLADELLHGCQSIRILATSRQSLAVMGEFVHRVQSLSVPDRAMRLDAKSAIGHSSIALFASRAKAREERFALTDDTAPVVAEICRRVDGIPLAIELAAARVSHLSVDALADRIGHHFAILSTADRNALPRQRTMRAVIDWSYEHLSEPEQRILRRLATFVGGFTLELAIDACVDLFEDTDALDLLASLIDKSLIQTEFRADSMRYRMLESTRQYARERCDAHSETATCSRAHALAMLKLAERLDAAWENAAEGDWLAKAVCELGNIHASLEWTLQSGGALEVGQQIVGSLESLWDSAPDGRRWVNCALDSVTCKTPEAIRARLELAIANLGYRFDKLSELQAAQSALVHYTRQGNPSKIPVAQLAVGNVLVHTGRTAEGVALIRSGLETARRLGLRKVAARALRLLGLERLLSGDFGAARALLEEALTWHKLNHSNDAVAYVSLALAEVEFGDGRTEDALRRIRDTVAVCHRGLQRIQLAVAFANSAAYLVMLERFDEARESAVQALTLAREVGIEYGVAIAMQHLVAVALLRPNENSSAAYREHLRAARLLGFVDARFEQIGRLRDHTEQQEFDKIVAALQLKFDRGQLAQLFAEGKAWNDDEAEAVALEI